MIPGFHGLDLIVIRVIALLIFGPKRLPEMGASIGKSIKEFRKGMNELTTPKEEEEPKLPAANVTRSASQMDLSSVPYESEMAAPRVVPQPVVNEVRSSEVPVE